MIFLLLALSLLSCRNDQSRKVRDAAAQNISQAQSALENSQPTSEELKLSIGKTSARKGETLCLGVTAQDFTNLISMQYSIRWDPKVLRFEKVDGFNLPWLSEDNFGMHITDEGIVTFVWIDNDLRGVSVNNGDEIYQLCFEVIGEAGQESEVALAKDPTPFEVVTAAEKVIPLTTDAGGVRVE